ncbi:MAG: CRISPR-associated ring nuclease Csm6 [Candidatus Competibacteraceae bacterium]
MIAAYCSLSPVYHHRLLLKRLYALAVARQPPYPPTELHLITTADGAERARLTLLHDVTGWYHQLCRDYGLTGIRFTEDNIRVLRDTQGTHLSDIRTPSHNEAAADQITAVVRELTADPDSAVHASIAGGRKTMGFYLGYAMSLFGRPQDRLSHVLVAAPFESNQQFYYPTRESRVIYTQPPEQRPLDTRDAQVTLAEIPFVRLRDGLDEELLSGSSSFSETVRRAQLSLAAPDLVLDPATRRVRCGSLVLNLAPVDFAFLAWFARRVLRREPGICRTQISTAERDAFLAEYNALHGEMDQEADRVRIAVQDGMTCEYFDARLSHLQKQLKRHLGKAGAWTVI